MHRFKSTINIDVRYNKSNRVHWFSFKSHIERISFKKKCIKSLRLNTCSTEETDHTSQLRGCVLVHRLRYSDGWNDGSSAKLISIMM